MEPYKYKLSLFDAWLCGVVLTLKCPRVEEKVDVLQAGINAIFKTWPGVDC